MKVALSGIGKFHTFDLARELHSRGLLAGVFSGYPKFKLNNERLPDSAIHTFPWVQTPYLAMPRRDLLGIEVNRLWEYISRSTFDNHVARHLPACDVFVGLSSSALNTGVAAQRRGARYVCDRGSTHIVVQNDLLRDEHERWGVKFEGVDPRIIEREQAEYAAADLITVPSSFNQRSFVAQGVAADKVKVVPYGVDLKKFSPTAQPEADRFDVIFVGAMSLRKGVPDLIKAFGDLQHPRKSLSFIGSTSPALIADLRKRGLWSDDIQLVGHVQQEKLKDLMSRAHVMVLPSIEEGLAMVQAQAMACGCPVIATEHTGAENLFTHGEEGYIVPIRRPDAIAAHLQHLADHPDERARMGQRALQKVQGAGGWRDYGELAAQTYMTLLGRQ